MITEPSSSQPQRVLWLMLTALVSGFVLSMAFRTIIAISASPLAEEMNASATTLGVLTGTFHVAFSLAQPAVGIALDRYGPRRVVLTTFLLAVLGSFLSTQAESLTTLTIGQGLIGIGCSPALLAAMMFIARRFPADRFAAVSGAVLSAGGAGMLLTGTPLAWVIEVYSWRAGFVALTVLAAMSWVSVLLLVEDEPKATKGPDESIGEALRSLGAILRQPHTAGICCLAATSYAAFLSLRGLWLGPLLVERHHFSVIETGHAAFAVSLVGAFGPLVFGRIDPGGWARRQLITVCSAGYIVLFVLQAIGFNPPVDVALLVVTSFFTGYVSLQYADLRSAYPEAVTGRALSVFTMAMFLGVAGVQWLSGVAATFALTMGVDPVSAALMSVSALLMLGTLAFWLLPPPPGLAKPASRC